MDLKELIPHKLQEKFPQVKFEFVEYRGDLSVKFNKEHVTEICRFLKEESELDFRLCEDVTAIDWAKRKNRFTVHGRIGWNGEACIGHAQGLK